MRLNLCGGAVLAALLLPAVAGAQTAPPAGQTAPPAGRGAGPRSGGSQPASAEVVAAPRDTRLADAAARRDAALVAKLLATKGIDLNGIDLDGSTALGEALRYGDAAMTAQLIKAGADVNRPNRYGLSPIILAAQQGAVDIMGQLIKAGADANAVDPAGESALVAATREGTPQVVALLLDSGAKIDGKDPTYGQTALMVAVREDHPAIVELLIKRGGDINAQTRVGAAPRARPPGDGGGSHGEGIVRGGWPAQGARGPQPGGMTALNYAARDGRIESVRLLLGAGAKIELADANGMTPLLMALLNDNLTTAQLLIERGANVNAQDWYGRTPLWSAVEARNLEVNGPKKDNGVDRPLALQVIKALLNKGADPNARTKEYPPDRRFLMGLGSLAWVDFTGQTPFIHAALSGDVDGMKLLLQYKADPKIATISGTTALAAAAGVNWVGNQTWTEGPDKLLEAVKLCVDLGLDVNATNDMGLTPLHGAANRGSDEIIRYLVSKGGKLAVKDKVGRTPLVWAGGIFLASNAPEPKPATQALIKELLIKQEQAALEGSKPARNAARAKTAGGGADPGRS